MNKRYDKSIIANGVRCGMEEWLEAHCDNLAMFSE